MGAWAAGTLAVKSECDFFQQITAPWVSRKLLLFHKLLQDLLVEHKIALTRKAIAKKSWVLHFELQSRLNSNQPHSLLFLFLICVIAKNSQNIWLDKIWWSNLRNTNSLYCFLLSKYYLENLPGTRNSNENLSSSEQSCLSPGEHVSLQSSDFNPFEQMLSVQIAGLQVFLIFWGIPHFCPRGEYYFSFLPTVCRISIFQTLSLLF